MATWRSDAGDENRRMGDVQDDGYWLSLHDTEGLERQAFLRYLKDALGQTGHPLSDLTAIVLAGTLYEFYSRALMRWDLKLSLLETETYSVPFAVIIRTARSLEVLPKHLAGPLFEFAHLRNRFAHDIRSRLGDEDEARLDKTLSKDLRKKVADLKVSALDVFPALTGASAYMRVLIACIGDELEDLMRASVERYG